MMTKYPTLVAVLLLIASSVSAAEEMTVDFGDVPAAKLKGIRVEVLEISVAKPTVAFRDDASKIPQVGLALPSGTYKVYFEDKKTGLILPQENAGVGYTIAEQGRGLTLGVERAQSVVSAAGLSEMVSAIHEKDKAERKDRHDARKLRLEERRLAAAPGKDPQVGGHSPRALEDQTSAAQATSEQDFAPGELLIKFKPEVTLAERYQLMQELNAENRSKIDPIDVYRVQVGEGADLLEIISRLANDSRIKFIEKNVTVSVPEPLVEGR